MVSFLVFIVELFEEVAELLSHVIHVTSRTIVSHRIDKYKSYIVFKVAFVFVFIPRKLDFDGLEIHWLFDHMQVIWNSKSNRIDWLIENPRGFVFHKKINRSLAKLSFFSRHFL